jgi:hypothetical protein
MKFLIFACLFLGLESQAIYNCHALEINISDDEINKILKAKEIVRNMVNYPDTLVFHDFSTKVSGNTVTLKFTCKNAFGTPETHVMDIKVN